MNYLLLGYQAEIKIYLVTYVLLYSENAFSRVCIAK